MKMNNKNLYTNFDQIYDIMKESFPELELRTYEKQKELLNDHLFKIYTKQDDFKTEAFLTCWSLPSCTFIEHLATAEQCRGRGYGKDLLLECIGESQKPVFLEIEPVTSLDPMTGKRAAFYQRLGFFVNDFAYQQQPLQEGHEPLDLWILSYGNPISQDQFLPYKKEIYSYVYKVALE